MLKDIFDRPAIQILSPSVKKIQYSDLPLIVIHHPLCQAIVSFQGAQLLSWTPVKEQRPIVWLSEKALFHSEKPIRGGVPLCWPWFGPVHSPSHGFARLLCWTLISLEENQEGVTLQLELRDSAATHELWPHAFETTVTLHLGQTARIELSCRGNFNSTAALHTYFNVASIDNTFVTGLGHQFEEMGTSTTLASDHSREILNKATDRIYTHPDSITYLHDSDRIIKISHHDASDVVLWNPWKEGAKKINDMAEEDYQHMICIETARIHQPLISTIDAPAFLGVTIETVE